MDCKQDRWLEMEKKMNCVTRLWLMMKNLFPSNDIEFKEHERPKSACEKFLGFAFVKFHKCQKTWKSETRHKTFTMSRKYLHSFWKEKLDPNIYPSMEETHTKFSNCNPKKDKIIKKGFVKHALNDHRQQREMIDLMCAIKMFMASSWSWTSANILFSLYPLTLWSRLYTWSTFMMWEILAWTSVSMTLRTQTAWEIVACRSIDKWTQKTCSSHIVWAFRLAPYQKEIPRSSLKIQNPLSKKHY